MHPRFRSLGSQHLGLDPGAVKPRLAADGKNAIGIEHPHLAPMRLVCDGAPELLFCDNETNAHGCGLRTPRVT